MSVPDLRLVYYIVDSMSSLFTFKLLRIYNSLLYIYDSVYSITSRIYDVVHDLYYPKTYLFFSKNGFPYECNIVNTDASSCAVPKWMYIPENWQFIEWGYAHIADLTLSHSLPILSMEIVQGDTVLYDLTDFIEKVRVYNDSIVDASPCMYHIVGAWSISSGIVLDPATGYTVRIINTNAETVIIPANSNDPIRSLEDTVTEVVKGVVDTVSKED